MKQKIYYLFLSLILIGCSSNVKDKTEAFKSVEQLERPNINSLAAVELKTFKEYNIRDTIRTDLNGDSILDLAYFKTISTKKAITVMDGRTKKEIRVGLDKSFKEIGDNFNWVDLWGTTNDKEIYENIILDGEIIGGSKVKLINASIFVSKADTGGGIITFKHGKFVWIHQAD